ncbi:hypothetical protein ACA910_016859 [Epithemia clementina (nom. ined.)]
MVGFTFTFTAPIVSEEDEKRELEELSEREAAALRDDVYGNHSHHNSTTIPDRVYSEGIRFVEEAIDSMEDSKKEAFVTARKLLPDRLDKECPFRAYLDYTNFDVWKAADLIVNYWTLRRYVFGSQRAFMPMTLDGAMAEDKECLADGVMMHVEDDDRGRPVHFYDRVRMDTRSEAARKMFLRVFFYMHQIRFERPQNFVAIINGRGYDLNKHYDRKFSKDVIAVSDVFPGDVKAIHFCFDGFCRSVVNLVVPIYKHMYGKHMRMRMVFHCGNSVSEISASIKEYGLRDVHAEAVFGGILWNPPRARAWLDERREVENQQAQNADDPM